MTKDELEGLPEKIRIAVAAGVEAANAQPDDGGSANLDRVVIPMRRVRESTIAKHGLPGYLSAASRWHGRALHLDAPFRGQGNRRYAGVQAMHKSLQAQGVNCYVYYQID